MKIIGQRILVSKVEEPVQDGFQTVEVQDSFVFKGKIEIFGEDVSHSKYIDTGIDFYPPKWNIGDVVLFSKYSPDTQEVEHEGKKMKIIKVDDILAVL